MRLLRCSIYLGVWIIMALLLAATVQAGVVTVDIAAKSAVSDSDKIEGKGVRVIDKQMGVCIQNTTLDPQSILLKVDGLTELSYDVYVDGAYVKERSAAELQKGIPLSLSGTIGNPDMMRCLKSVLPALEAEYKRLQGSEDEAGRVWHTIRQAREWASSGVRVDDTYRSVSVIIAPAGRMLTKMSYPTKLSVQQTNDAIGRACTNLQNARDRMYDNIKDLEVRNAAVAALTPVTFSATYTLRNGKAHIDAKVANNTDLPISGSISMALPKGWKTNAKTLEFADLRPGRSFGVAFDLVAPAKGAVAPDSVPIAANVTIAQGTFEAGLKLKTNAVKAVNSTP